MGRARLTYDKILITLVEIKSIMNSLSLTYMSDNHNESCITASQEREYYNNKKFREIVNNYLSEIWCW